MTVITHTDRRIESLPERIAVGILASAPINLDALAEWRQAIVDDPSYADTPDRFVSAERTDIGEMLDAQELDHDGDISTDAHEMHRQQDMAAHLLMSAIVAHRAGSGFYNDEGLADVTAQVARELVAAPAARSRQTQLFSTGEVAALLGLSHDRVSELARSRGVGRQVGRRWVFTADDINGMRIRVPGRPRSNGGA